MTANDFADLLSKLLDDAEDAGLSSEELVDMLDVMAEAIRDEDMAPSTRTTKERASRSPPRVVRNVSRVRPWWRRTRSRPVPPCDSQSRRWSLGRVGRSTPARTSMPRGPSRVRRGSRAAQADRHPDPRGRGDHAPPPTWRGSDDHRDRALGRPARSGERASAEVSLVRRPAPRWNHQGPALASGSQRTGQASRYSCLAAFCC